MARGRIACLLGQGFEDSEFRKPYDALKKAGWEVDIISMKSGEELKGYKGKESVKSDTAIDEADVEDYEGLLIPGGQSPDHLRVDQRIVDFVKRFDQTGRTVAAVCHGPQLLMAAGLVKGRTLTAWQTIQADLRLIDGVNVKDEAVVVDKNWVTSRKPDDLDAFSAKMLEELDEQEEREGGRPAERPQPHA